MLHKKKKELEKKREELERELKIVKGAIREINHYMKKV